MKILILGAGGTGGYFGGRLHQGGADVTFLVREKRAQHVAEHGLVIESPNDLVTLRVKTVLAAEVKPEYDIVILSCKAWDLDSSIAALIPAMSPAVAAHTCVVPLLNGMSHLDALDAAFGRERVMGGTCQIAATLTKDGIIRSMAEMQSITWGAREASQIEAARVLGDEFAKTAVVWKVSDNIMQDMWEKITYLSTLAGMTCLMRAPVGDILAAPDGRDLMRRYVNACEAIAAREGYPPRPHMAERFRNVLNSSGSTLTASMLRDLESGGQIEADHIVGFMLTKAREHGIDDTMLTVAYAHLKAYELRRGERISAA